jgi:hypothetical protein
MAQQNSSELIAQGDKSMADLNFTPNGNADAVWEFLMGFVHNPKGVAGMMGNLYYESQCYPYKVYGDNSIPPSQRSIIYTEHFNRGDAGYDMTTFMQDGKAYGLAQWLTPARKQGLYEGKAHNSSAIRYPSSSYSIGSLNRAKDFLKYELLDVAYYSSDYTAMVNSTDERATALTIVQHYEGIASDDGSFSTRQKLANQIYTYYTGLNQNTIYINVTGNGTAYVDNYHPDNGEDFTLYAIANSPDTLDDITAQDANGYWIAMDVVPQKTYPYDENNWGKYINIYVDFSGETPPSPPTPTPTLPPHHMPIWMYPKFRI